MNARKRIDIEPGNSSLSLCVRDFEQSNPSSSTLSKQYNEKKTEQFNSGEFKNYLQSQFPKVLYWSGDRWKACLAAGGGANRIYQYCTDVSGIIVYFRALQGHSGRNLIDPSLQDNVVIQNGFFQHIYHIRCAFYLHAIINNGLIPGGQNSSKRTDGILFTFDPRDKGHKDPEKIVLNVPRRAQYLHSAWKKHQDAVYLFYIDLAIRKGLIIYQTRSNAIILQGNTSSLLYSKSCQIENWRSLK